MKRASTNRRAAIRARRRARTRKAEPTSVDGWKVASFLLQHRGVREVLGHGLRAIGQAILDVEAAAGPASAIEAFGREIERRR